MTNISKQDTYLPVVGEEKAKTRALKVGMIATASALAGGLAVAWWYKETLKKLRNPIHLENLPKRESFNGEFPDTNLDEFDTSEPGTLPDLVQDETTSLKAVRLSPPQD